MKKLMILIISFLLVFSMTSCKKESVNVKNEPEQTSEPINDENNDLDDLGEIVKSQDKVIENNKGKVENKEIAEADIIRNDYEKFEGTPISSYAEKGLEMFMPYLTEKNGLDTIKQNYKRPITRQELAKLTRVFIEEIYLLELEVPDISEFEDTIDNDILKVYNRNVITGRDRRTFAPDSFIKREEAAACGVRAAQLICTEYEKNPSDILLPPIAVLPHEDKNGVSSGYDIEVRIAFANGFMTGATDKLWIPNGTITIEESIRLFENIKNKLDS